MNCPRCYRDNIRTHRTERHDGFDIRVKLCEDCGARWRCIDTAQYVYVYNPRTLRDELIPFSEYKARYFDYHIGQAKHPDNNETNS